MFSSYLQVSDGNIISSVKLLLVILIRRLKELFDEQIYFIYTPVRLGTYLL